MASHPHPSPDVWSRRGGWTAVEGGLNLVVCRPWCKDSVGVLVEKFHRKERLAAAVRQASIRRAQATHAWGAG
jgi:hypothetical protein